MQQQVFWFEVSVHDVVPVEHFEGFDYLGKIGEGYSFWQHALLLEQFFEGAAVAKLIDEVEIVGSFEHIEVLDDVRAWLEGGKDFYLVVGALLQLGVLLELFSLDHLDRHFLLVLYVYCSVDRRVHASSYLALQRVVIDHLTHPRSLHHYKSNRIYTCIIHPPHPNTSTPA